MGKLICESVQFPLSPWLTMTKKCPLSPWLMVTNMSFVTMADGDK